MAEEFKILLGAELKDGEIERIQKQISGASKNNANSVIKFRVDTGDFKTKFDSVNSKLKSFNSVSEQIRKNIAELDSAFKALNSSNTTDGAKLEAYKKFNLLLPVINRQLKEIATTEREVSTAQQALTKSNTLSNKIKAWMNDNTKAAQKYREVLNEILNQLSGNKDPALLKKLTMDFAEVQSAARAAGLTVNSFAKSLKNTLLQVVGLTSSVAALQKAWEIFKEMYQNVYKIDTAMTNLKKVTEETDSTYSRFLSSANESAKELGRSVSSLVEQTANWAKLGYSIHDAEELAKLSSVYANVGEVDDETAVSDMVTAMKAFNIEASSAITIVDSLNELGNNFATSAAALGTGLSKSASAMNAANTDMYKTLAMLTGGVEITQNASEFGNFLKAASMRVRGKRLFMPILCENKGLHTSIIKYAA